MNHRRIRRIISYIVSFILMLCILCTSLLVVGKVSMLSRHGVIHTFEKVGFYEGMAEEIRIQAYELGIPYGISKDSLNSVFVTKKIQKDLLDIIDAELKGEKTVIRTDEIRNKIKSNVQKQKGKLSAEQEESLEWYIVEVERMYQKKIKLPVFDSVVKMINLSTKLVIVAVPVCVIVAILCMIYLIATRRRKYRGMRYIVYSIIGGGITLTVLFAALVSDGFVYRFNISDVYMRRFFTYFIGHQFVIQAFTGLGLIGFGIIMMYATYQRRLREF